MASVSKTPWSSFSDGDYSDEQYRRAAVLDRGEGSSVKERYGLPVKEPDGKLNEGGLRAAARMLNQVKGASDAAKKKAARALARMFKQAGMDVPEGLQESADASYQLPFDDLEAVNLSQSVMRKQIIPLRSISYNGGELSFDREKIRKIAENFQKKPFELVPFNISGSHSDDPLRTGGEVIGMEATDSGLDAIISLNDQGREAVQRNDNRLPVSVRFMEDYSRESDGEHFGPCVAHVAATFSPRMHGMSGWQPVDASEDGEVVDLTGESYEEDASPDSGLSAEEQAVVEEVEREIEDEANTDEETDDSSEEEDMADMPKEGDSVQFKRGGATHEGTFKRMDGENAVVEVDGEEVKVPAGMLQKKADEDSKDSEPKDNSERSGGLDLAELEARDARIAELENKVRSSDMELRRQRVERELEEYGRAGVPAADLSLARPLLMDDDSGVELSYTDLSEDGAEEKKSARGDLVRKMLDARKGAVEFGEKGDASAQLSEDDDMTQRTHERMKETGESFPEAARHITPRS